MAGIGLVVLLSGAAYAQKIEIVNGVRVVHNVKGGKWGAQPQVSLKLVRSLGDINIEDDQLAFNVPQDALIDAAGNLYVLDSGNQRIQKFGPDGKYLATIGRKGQGPGEFNYPESFDLDASGNIYVLESMRKLLHVLDPNGKELKTVRFLNDMVMSVRLLGPDSLAGLVYPMTFSSLDSKERSTAKLVKLYDFEGKAKAEMGEQVDFGDRTSTAGGNVCFLDADRRGRIYLTFMYQNRIEAYSPQGKLLWTADRPLSYGTKMLKKGKFEQSGDSISIQGPEFNQVSSGLAADDRGRVWIITYLRQLKKEEKVFTTMGSVGGNVSVKVTGDQERPLKDVLALDIFDSNGVLLGSIPLPHFADHIRIVKDNLLLIDSQRLSKVYHYKIMKTRPEAEKG
jgi:sugar lactone lactonase YvrE